MGGKNIMLFLIFVISLIVGLVFSWGPDVWLFFLTYVGSFERLSWFSLIGTAVIAGYWIILAMRMYSHANANIELVEDGENFETPKVGKKALVIGVIMTILWIGLFIFTDGAALAAQSFATWQIKKATSLAIARKFGHLLLAFSAGILLSLNLLRRHTPRRRRKNVEEETQKEVDR